MRLFIVDDSSLICERIRDVVSEISGFEIVGEAVEQSEAIQSINKTNPDVVILDIRLPKGNGIEVLRELKNKEHAPVVIVLTNYPYPQYRTKCNAIGADHFFDKSTEFGRIKEVLKQLITSSRAQQN
jgi:DNA-binding NarL/FixJ family response regulator